MMMVMMMAMMVMMVMMTMIKRRMMTKEAEKTFKNSLWGKTL